jgi:hypothetical protein
MREVLTPTDYADIAVAAIEGGINYWAAVSDYKFQFDPKNPDEDFVTARIYELGDDDEIDEQRSWGLDSRSNVWKHGVAKAAEMQGQSLEEFLEDHDAGTADAALQFALFGELVYG